MSRDGAVEDNEHRVFIQPRTGTEGVQIPPPGANPFWFALRFLCNLQLCRLFFTMVGNMPNMWDSKPLN